MKNKKILSGLMALAICIGTVVGSLSPVAYAEEGTSGKKNTITMSNQATNTEGEYINGAVYTVTQTEGGYDTVANKYKEATLTPFDVELGKAGQTGFPEGVSVDISDDNNKTFITVPDGSYTIVQKTPATGYYKDTQEIKVQLPATSEDGSTVEHNVDVNPKMSKILKTIVLTKLDGAGNPVNNATFSVKRSTDSTDGTDGSFEVYNAETTYVTNEEGKITLQNVPFGWYQFQETNAPDGFVLSNEVYKIHVQEDEDNQTELNVSATNYKEPSATKSVEVEGVKGGTGTVDDPFIAEEGFTLNYTITVDLPEDIKDYKKFNVIDKLPSELEFAPEAQANIKIVDQDDADVKEKFNANIVGDTLTVNPITFSSLDGVKTIKITFSTVIKDGVEPGTTFQNTYKLEWTNKWDNDGEKDGNDPTSVTPPYVKVPANKLVITKIDGKTSAKLQNAEFELYLLNGEDEETLVGTKQVTTGEGLVSWDNLKNGTYLLKEVKAPDSDDDVKYRKLDKGIKIVLDNSSKDKLETAQTVKNYKTNVFIPNTGTLGAIGFATVGLLLVSGAAVLSKRKKEVQ